MPELLIRNGTVVDGTGAPPVPADVLVRDGVIVAVAAPGTVSGSGGHGPVEVIDADGLLVTPGWVDVHTHYDGQVTWDPLVSPSCWHGVTTVVMGNCGVGFAPVRPAERGWLVALMEGVEDIPGTALVEGMRWEWESFPEYLDAISRMPRLLDVGTQIAHGPLRAYVMGERGARNEPATAADIERMAEIVGEAVRAGALGFTTSRTLMHRAVDGEPVPGTFAAEDELFGIGRALEQAGAGLFEVAPAGIAGEDDLAPAAEMAWMRRLAGAIGRPVTFGMTQSNSSPHLYQLMLDEAAAAAAEGARVVPQVAGRPTGLLFGLETTYHPFGNRPSYASLAGLSAEEKLERLRDPAVRAAILGEKDPDGTTSLLTAFADRITPIRAVVDYEPAPEVSVGHLAAVAGRDVGEVLYDMMIEGGPEQQFLVPILNYADRTLDAVRDMILSPQAVFGLGDGGAHCAIICDASMPTTNLTLWARDRSRGERLPLELVVRKQTLDTAELYGLHDRGVIAPGYKGDINVIDFARLRALPPEIAHDLPGGTRRLVQRAEGYVATIVSGEVVTRDGEITGARPGTVVRGGRLAPAAVAAGQAAD